MNVGEVADAPTARPGRLLRVVLIVHGIVALAAAVVLIVAPGLIPSTVGIAVGRDEFLLSYFLAAAELAVGLLSLGAVRLNDVPALRLIVGVFAVFHLATAALEVLYLSLTGLTPALVINIAARLVAAAFFFVVRSTLRPTPR